MVWYAHLFQNFPQFIVIRTVKGFGIVNTAEVDAFLQLSCFFFDPADVGNLISGSIAIGFQAPNTIIKPCILELLGTGLQTIYWMLGSGALGRPRGREWRGRREEGSGWGTHVHPWRIHVDI